ncbi:MAG: ComF family protein [Chloroflexota bacterium]
MIRTIVDLVYPPRCVGCGHRGAWLCERCVGGFARLEPNYCPRCGYSTSSSALCPACRHDPPSFDALLCAYRFEDPLRAAIHRLKYGGARQLAEPLARAALRSVGPLPQFQAIVPVPLHPNRLAHRGFNQSALLARSIGKSTGVPVYLDHLQRVRDTPSQITRTARERRLNLEGAFQAELGDLVGAAILLVDDVATTGSTLRASASALRQAGAGRVSALVLARAV